MKPYLLDGQEVTASELIGYAKRNYGYNGDGFLLQTSKAARILRDNGHKVEENKQKVAQ